MDKKGEAYLARAGGERQFFREEIAGDAEKEIELEALKRSRPDIALFCHHRSLLAGEFTIYLRGETHQCLYSRTLHLRQYRAVEKSVIQGWRRYVEKTMGVPPSKQKNIYEGNRAIVSDALRRKPQDKYPEVLKRRSETFRAAAERGDVGFFQAVGRLLTKKSESSFLKRFEYAEAMLSHWLTDFYWLMPDKLASYRLSVGLGVADKPKSFAATKSRYGLKSHRPPLIQHFELRDGIGRGILTAEGQRLLG